MKELGRRKSPDIKQIDVDVLRTFRNHVMYRERYGIKQQALFHVLVAYSMYNPVYITVAYGTLYYNCLSSIRHSVILKG
jgi:hypothetical protein